MKQEEGVWGEAFLCAVWLIEESIIEELSSLQITDSKKLSLSKLNNILIAKLYGLNQQKFETIPSTFKVLNDKQPQYIELLKSLWESVGTES